MNVIILGKKVMISMQTKSPTRLPDLVSHSIARRAPELYEARRDEAERAVGLLLHSIEIYKPLRREYNALGGSYLSIKRAMLNGQFGGMFENVLDHFVIMQFGILAERAKPVVEELAHAQALFRQIENEFFAVTTMKTGQMGRKRGEGTNKKIAKQAIRIAYAISSLRQSAYAVYEVSAIMARSSREKLKLY